MMDSITPLDLAANCAELIGTVSFLAVKLNQILRVYRNVPIEVRQLQASVARTKQIFDQLLPLLDQDQPAFQHTNDVQALNLHFKSITHVIHDVQSHVAKVEQTRSSPFPEWATVQHLWEVDTIAESSLRLNKQLAGLEVYLKVTRSDNEVQQPVVVTNLGDKICLSEAWDDAAVYMDPPASRTAPKIPDISIDGSHSPAQTRNSGDISPVTGSSHDFPNTPASSYGTMVPYTKPAEASELHNSIPSRQALTATLSQLDIGGSRQNGYWRDAIKGQGFNMPSARKIKSVAMLQKAPIGSAIIQGATGDELFPTEFRTRVSGYARGISPIWELVLVPTKKMVTKQRFRNRFTRHFTNNLSPEKLQSQFKVTEKKLWDAILNREFEKVAGIMEHRFSDNIVVEKRDRLTVLHLAASLGLCNVVQLLVSLGANPNHPDKYGATALHHAADFGCASCLRILVLGNGKVDLDSPKTRIRTPLFYAAKSGNADATRALLDLGAHVYTFNTIPQETVLYAAVESGNVEVCDAVISKGGNPGESFATLALAAATSRRVLTLLVEAGANLDIRDENQETLLLKYVMNGDADMVSFLIFLGATLESATDQSGRSLLLTVLDKGGLPEAAALVKLLLEAGDRPDVQNSLGQTPLHLAVVWGRADAAEVLCRKGANMNMADSRGVTPVEEVQMLGYERRAGNSTLADFPGTREVLYRWQQGGVPRIPEVDGRSMAVPEMDGKLTEKPRVPLATNLQPNGASDKTKPRVELGDSRQSIHEMDARWHSFSKDSVIAELPAI